MNAMPAEFQAVENCPMWKAGTQLKFCKEQQVLLTWEPSFSPASNFFKK